MTKASPLRGSFNAGIFSILVEGRVDIDRYPASMRDALNVLLTPQGPAMRRSGSYFMTEAYSHATKSHIIPFVFSEEQANILEFAHERLRFVFETGLQVYTAAPITNVTQLSPMIITSATLGADVGDQVALSGFPVEYNLNGVVANITAKSSDDYTLDIDYPGSTGAVSGPDASRVYHIVSPYEQDDAPNIRAVQSFDVLYLFCKGYRPRKLSRFDTYDWQFSLIEYNTGPFMDEKEKRGQLAISATGSAISGGTASASSNSSGNGPGNAFDSDSTTFWESNSEQGGWIKYDFGVGNTRTPIGYVIYMARTNNDLTYSSVDYAPGDFTFEASNDDSTWFVLDAQKDYVLYESGRSVFFKINNNTAYRYIRVWVTKCTRNGPLKPRIQRLEIADKDGSDITLTLSGVYDDFNGGEGFKSTDVGRLLRVKGTDAHSRILKIKTFTSATSVVATLLDEPFPNTEPILDWQAGYFSNTTGWPTLGGFFEDRLCVSGITDAPGVMVLSRTGAYEDYAQRNPLDEVLDDSAILVRLNSKRASGVQWIETDERGILIGTGSEEWVLAPANPDQAFTSRNIKARSSTARGSAYIEPVKIDRQILYVQASRRTVREYAYVFEADGYKSPSMSLFASNLGVPRLAQVQYAAEPHSILWFRRDDGTVVGLTYQREENVIGWHRHDFAGGVVESLAVIPSDTDKQDVLWMVIRREIDGDQKRYIERLVRSWDFDSVIEEAHFVDCGLYLEEVDPFTEVYSLQHLEGESLVGLADGIPVADLLVTDGKITLPFPARKLVIGLKYDMFGEISRIEAGAEDGTAQGKVKRMHNASVLLWDTYGGDIATWDEEEEEYKWQPIEYRENYAELEPIKLFTGMVGPFNLERGYGKRGTIAFRQELPLPFNIVTVMPQLNTQDR